MKDCRDTFLDSLGDVVDQVVLHVVPHLSVRVIIRALYEMKITKIMMVMKDVVSATFPWDWSQLESLALHIFSLEV